jgi:dienelactone hydrolase
MHSKRREFIKLGGLTGLTLASGDFLKSFAATTPAPSMENLTMTKFDPNSQSIIGNFGEWAAGLVKDLPSNSFRRDNFKNVKKWQTETRALVTNRMSVPDIGGMPEVTVKKQYTYDGLHIEELTWQLPYGNPTEAILLKPENASGPLPAILAFHDHGGNKYFGTRKITKTSDEQHPKMVYHQDHYYEGKAWANEMAKKGYVVLVSDAFTFGSRRVMLKDVPENLRHGLSDNDPENEKNIDDYNTWAGEHEHVMAKSLFCAGTTWPGVFFAEDRKALDILAARKDVDASRIGCGGLSGGGIRTDFMAGLDPRIKCSVTIGFQSTWKDFLLNKSYTHTWMTYVPLLPKELDFPEILGLRVPAATLVQNDEDDQLYTLAGMKEADKVLKAVFDKAGAQDRYKCSYYPGLHKFDLKMQTEAFDWFDRWLKA